MAFRRGATGAGRDGEVATEIVNSKSPSARMADAGAGQRLYLRGGWGWGAAADASGMSAYKTRPETAS